MAEPQSLTHIAFILDGNRRWAIQNGKAKFEGHKAGYERLKEISQACFDRGIEFFSAYIFSTENWQREEKEVGYIMELALWAVGRDLEELHQKGIRIVVSGFRDKLSQKLLRAIDNAVKKTKNNTKGTLNLCFNYGGQQEIVRATQEIIEAGIPAKKVDLDTIKQHLFTQDIPAPDLIVRTSGEQRLSNFLLWDSAYAELSFLPVFWPDFDQIKLDAVIADYQSRERRNGK